MFGANVAPETTRLVILLVVDMNNTRPSTGFVGKVIVSMVNPEVGGAIISPEHVSVSKTVSPERGVEYM